jgi:D-glycero-alpha-D-manno-heptose-7-phosphate kinase
MIVCRTPMRVSFFGGGTDFPEFFEQYGGAVLGAAIDKFIYHTVIPFPSQLFDYCARLAYSKVECVTCVEEIKHRPFREVMSYLGVTKDVEISITSDLPAFSGVGSSSSFVVGLLKSLMAFQGRVVPQIDLAYTAIYIEREIMKEAVGCQDQVFAAMGGINLLEFIAIDDIRVHRIPLSKNRIEELNESLMMFFTGIKRRANDIEERKIENVQLIKPSLLKMRQLVDRGYDILTGNQSLEQFGKLLHETWEMKRTLDPEVSNQAVDAMYSTALAAGATGGKLCGAGGGGFLLLFVKPERKETVRSALEKFHEIRIKCGAGGSQILSV